MKLRREKKICSLLIISRTLELELREEKKKETKDEGRLRAGHDLVHCLDILALLHLL